MKTAIQALGQVRDRAAKMSQDPANAGKSLGYAAEDKSCRCERGIKKKANQRHEPILHHGFNTDGICRMDMEDGFQLVRQFVEFPESLVPERHTINVAEDHGSAKMKLLDGATKLIDRCGRIIQGKGCQGDKASALVGDNLSKAIVDQRGKSCGRSWCFHMRAGRGERDDLSVDAGFTKNLLPEINIAMAANSDVVVAGIVQPGVTGIVMSDADGAWPTLQGLNVFWRIVVVVKINYRHRVIGKKIAKIAVIAKSAKSVKPTATPKAKEH